MRAAPGLRLCIELADDAPAMGLSQRPPPAITGYDIGPMSTGGGKRVGTEND